MAEALRLYAQFCSNGKGIIDAGTSIMPLFLIWILGYSHSLPYIIISLISLSKYSKTVKPEDFSGKNLLLYNTAKTFMETKYPPFTLKSLVELDDETFKALLVAACIMRKGKNLILNEVKNDYACISC